MSLISFIEVTYWCLRLVSTAAFTAVFGTSPDAAGGGEGGPNRVRVDSKDQDRLRSNSQYQVQPSPVNQVQRDSSLYFKKLFSSPQFSQLGQN